MRHAFLIIAHNNWRQLKKLIQLLDCENHDIFVHIDKRAKGFDKSFFDDAVQSSDLSFFSEYKVYWGGFSIVQAEMLLFEEAAKRGYDYYHLLSGADLPLVSNSELDRFFSENSGYEFIQYDDEKLNNDPEIARRTRLYHFLQNYRRRFSVKALNSLFTFLERVLLVLQLLLRVNRTKSLDWQVKYGSQWVSISDALVNEILKNKEKIIKTFSKTNCADELFVQTVAYNCGFKDKLYKNNGSTPDNMRFIDWERGSNGNPYTFTKQDLGLLMSCGKLFARKFSETADEEIINDISSELTGLR